MGQSRDRWKIFWSLLEVNQTILETDPQSDPQIDPQTHSVTPVATGRRAGNYT